MLRFIDAKTHASPGSKGTSPQGLVARIGNSGVGLRDDKLEINYSGNCGPDEIPIWPKNGQKLGRPKDVPDVPDGKTTSRSAEAHWDTLIKKYYVESVPDVPDVPDKTKSSGPQIYRREKTLKTPFVPDVPEQRAPARMRGCSQTKSHSPYAEVCQRIWDTGTRPPEAGEIINPADTEKTTSPDFTEATHIPVRGVLPCPPFVGLDQQRYEFEPHDFLTLPAGNARMLAEAGIVEIISPGSGVGPSAG